MEDLIEVVEDELANIKAEPLDESYLQKIREGHLRKRETDLKKNSFWQYILEFYEWHDDDPRIVLEFEDYVNALTAEDIQQAAQDFLGTENQALFTLRPEAGKEE